MWLGNPAFSPYHIESDCCLKYKRIIIEGSYKNNPQNRNPDFLIFLEKTVDPVFDLCYNLYYL